MREWIVRGRKVGTLAVAAALMPLPAAAQERAAQQDTIVVTGKRQDAERKQEVRRFTRALSVVNGTDPIGRFDDGSLCPAVTGLGEEISAAIVARMRRVAEAAKVPLAKPGCRPSAILIVTPGTIPDTLTEMRRSHPRFFLDAAERPLTMPRPDGPVYNWFIQHQLDRTGTPVNYRSGGMIAPAIVSDYIGGSRTSAIVRPVFIASMLMIEIDALEGLTTTQVADYAVMRLFTRIEPVRLAQTNASTIVALPTIPADQPVPASLTSWDLGYLRGLYAVHSFRSGRSQQAQIAQGIERELTTSE